MKTVNDVVQDVGEIKVWTTSVGTFVQLSRRKSKLVNEILRRVHKNHANVASTFTV
jgi:hypothetical protein